MNNGDVACNIDHRMLDGLLPDPAALQKEPGLCGLRQLSSGQLPDEIGIVRLPQGSPALRSIRKSRLSPVTNGIRLFFRCVEQPHLAF